MKKLFVEDFPRWKEGQNKDKINWEASVGLKIRFIYNEINSYLEILKYDKIKKRVLVKYNDSMQDMDINHLKKLAIKNLLNYNHYEDKPLIYKYKIGEIMSIATGDIQIIKLDKKKLKDHTQKRYVYKCLNDGYIGDIAEHYIKEDYNCPVCINKKVIRGINDVATTHPHLIKYFVNIEDAHEYSYGSTKKVLMKCIDCDYEKEMAINHLVNRGFSCAKCGDKVSYPEKFMFNVLQQVDVKFEYQKKFEWSQNKLYDFYIPYLSCIIEIHGLQHYQNNYSFSSKMKIEDIVENDKIKECLAKENNIKYYVVIDCREQEFKFVKNNISNSQISKLFNLDDVNWLKCHEHACTSLVKKVCNMWTGDFSCMKTICDHFKLSRQTIIKYLKQGKKLGWCNYDAKTNMRESARKNGKKTRNKIEVFNPLGKSLGAFNSAKEVSEISEKEFGIKLTASAISSVCRGFTSHHKKFTFKYTK